MSLGRSASPCLAAESLDAYFGAARVVRDVSFGVASGQVTAIIGPSGCGKSTLLRCLNRMHETVPGARVEGEVRFEGRDIYSPQVSAISVRRHIGMVFQRPTPFPTMSIRDNVAAGLKILPGRERPSRRETADIVERSLRHAALWDEVKDRLDTSAIDISGGQQQRLCIARALATSPTVLLLDEPTASLDPISTQRVEELVYELRSQSRSSSSPTTCSRPPGSRTEPRSCSTGSSSSIRRRTRCSRRRAIREPKRT